VSAPGLRARGLRQMGELLHGSDGEGESITNTNISLPAGGLGSGFLKHATTRVLTSSGFPYPDVRRLVHHCTPHTGFTFGLAGFNPPENENTPGLGIIVDRFFCSMFHVARRAHLAAVWPHLSGVANILGVPTPAKMRMGIYSCYEDGIYPQALLWDSGVFEAAIAGDEWDGAHHDATVGLDFAPGWYFFGATCDYTASSSVFCSADSLPDLGIAHPFSTGTNATPQLIGFSYDRSATAALLDPFPTSDAQKLTRRMANSVPSAMARWTLPLTPEES
jgi:hypothetical protein